MVPLADHVRQAGFASDAPLSIARFGPGVDLEVLSRRRWPDGATVGTGDKFYAASLAKQVTGVAAAVLVDAGRLDPDGPIATWLADLPPWCKALTPRQLAHHSAGLPAAGQLEAQVSRHWTESAAMAALARLSGPPLLPGACYAYSNIGYILLARVVSAVADLPFATFVSTRLFEPNGLGAMAFASDPAAFPQAALMGPSLPFTQGDGGLWSTAADFARWLQLLNDDRFGVASSVETQGRLTDGAAILYGWGQGIRSHRGHPLFVHGGEWPGAVVKAARSREQGFGIVAMASATPYAGLNRLVTTLMDTF